MKKFIDLTGASGIHALCLCQFFLRCIPDIFHRFKFTQKGFPPGITDPRDIIQDRMDLFPAPEGTMVFNGKPMASSWILVIRRKPSPDVSIGISTLLKYRPLVR